MHTMQTRLPREREELREGEGHPSTVAPTAPCSTEGVRPKCDKGLQVHAPPCVVCAV
jgi:hypothetical protein